MCYTLGGVLRVARRARKKSEMGIYHVIFRGINQQQIFEDAEDCEKYLQVLNDYKAVSGYKLLAYCLMGNHIHLLIKEEAETLEQIFKRISGRYVYWYNTKYRRIGHLFQDRYKSEAIDNDAYLMTVLRYIHRNPVKAQLALRPEDYRWSSYREYLMETTQIVDTYIALGIVTRDDFIHFHNLTENDSCLEVSEIRARPTDEEVRKIITKEASCETATQFQALAIEDRDEALRKLKEAGASVRQVSRLTGISKGVVERIFRT